MKRLLILIFMLALCMFLEPQKASASEVPLYEYWNPYIGDHFYTININEIGQYPTNGYMFEGAACNVFDTHQAGTQPLYRYYNYQIGDHFYTTDWNELGYGNYGWYFEQVECYVYTPGLFENPGIPLYEYWNGTAVTDHYYTTNWDELGEGRYGWYFEEVMCYVEPAD